MAAQFVKEAAKIQATFVGRETEKKKVVEVAGDKKKTENVVAATSQKQPEKELEKVEADAAGGKPEQKNEDSRPREVISIFLCSKKIKLRD